MLKFNNKLTKREKVLISIAVIVLIFATYYFLCYKPCKKLISNYSTDNLMEELTVENSKISINKHMKKEIEANKKAGVGEVFAYNNIQMEVIALNSILSQTRSFDIDFGPASQEGEAVKRVVDIAFTTANYDTAKRIIKKLYRCECRCLVGDVSIDSGDKDCSVSVQVTFIESMDGANTKEGLTKLKEINEVGSY